jgi:hypothetical protein
LAEVAQQLQAEPDLTDTLQAITEAAVANIPGAAHAGITLVTGGGRRVSTPASTDELVERLDRIRNDTQQGPCLDAIREQATVRSDDLTREERWPLFAAQACAQGVRSMLSFQLFVRAQDLGALNLYSLEVSGFDDHDMDIGPLFASHAAIALIGAQQQQGLQVAMDSRDLIGQAKGMLMERYHITGQRAFSFLVRTSQDSNRKLVDIATDVIRTGHSPTETAQDLPLRIKRDQAGPHRRSRGRGRPRQPLGTCVPTMDSR